MAPFYITTPIYYVNALPHLGTFYSTVVADAMARYHRARGNPTFFLTGLDEHGLKIQRMAAERGLTEQAYCDEIAGKFQATWRRAEISNDDFIRTTERRHEAAVAEMWRRMQDKGDIESREYEGLYCVGCEEFKAEDEVVAEDGAKLCPIHRTPVEPVKEKNYFFRLDKYQEDLLKLYRERPDFVRPESRRNEVESFVRGGLKAISASRMKKSVSWGIPVPGDPEHVVYVWIDALINYLTVLGGPAAVEVGKAKSAVWENAHHLIAKDILRFHAVYWPAMLMSAGLPLPKAVFCHGYLTVKGQKISKSIPATRVDPNAILDELGESFVDPLRYFVLREYTLGGDGDFTYESLFQRYESDLGNDLGNLLNRTVSMVRLYVGPTLNSDPADDPSIQAPEPTDHRRKIEDAWDRFQPSTALALTLAYCHVWNSVIEFNKPWKLAKEGKNDPSKQQELLKVLRYCCEALRWSALMIAPAMPKAADAILRQLGREQDAGKWPTDWKWPGGTLLAPQPVFPRIEPERQLALIAKWMPSPDAASIPPSASASASASAPAPAAPAAPAALAPTAPPAELTLDDFARVDLRVAKVLACEKVPKSDKLLKLTLDVGAGAEPRTVVSGIATAYQPADLVGRSVIYLANLKPAKIRGVISQGMILAAGDADVVALSALDRDAPPGTRVR